MCDFACALLSLIPRQMTVVFGLGTTLHVCMHNMRLENGILHNGQQLGSAVNSFIDLDTIDREIFTLKEFA